MKHTIFKTLIAALSLSAPLASAGEIGHYVAGMWGSWDHIVPPAGTTQLVMGEVYYKTSTLKNSSGNKVRGLDVDVSAPETAFILSHSLKERVLDARYSVGIVPAYGESSVNAHLAHTDLNKGNSRSGWYDLYVIPVNLTWDRSKYYSLSAQYAFWAPLGAYKSTRKLNTGLGYWSHDFRLTSSFYPCGEPTTLISLSTLYEANMEKQGTDITPGDRLVVEAGLSRVVNEHFIPGLLATGNWEITKTTGRESIDRCKDVVFSVGAEVNIPIVLNEWAVILRYLHEFGAKDRTEGDLFFALLEYQF